MDRRPAPLPVPLALLVALVSLVGLCLWAVVRLLAWLARRRDRSLVARLP